jgi:hypothetical protein
VTNTPAPALSSPHPEREAAHVAEWIEQAALHDMHAALPRALRTAAQVFSERGQGTLLLGAPGLPSVLTSRLFVAEDATQESIAGAVARLHERGAHTYFAHLDAGAPAAQRAALEGATLTRFHRPWLKLFVDRDRASITGRESSVPPGGIELRSARREDAEAFAALQLRCQGLDRSLAPLIAALVDRPRWHVFLASVNGVPVAGGALFVQGEVGWLGFGATLPEHRGQGLQRLVLQKRMRVALALGCRAIASETGVEVEGQKNSSCHNMLALGMRVVATRDNFAPRGAVWR